jgi:hypothetical protein
MRAAPGAVSLAEPPRVLQGSQLRAIARRARGMADEVDARAVGEQIVERGAAAAALQSIDAAKPAIVEHDDIQHSTRELPASRQRHYLCNSPGIMPCHFKACS